MGRLEPRPRQSLGERTLRGPRAIRRFLIIALAVLLSDVAFARDPSFKAQRRCKGKHPCAVLKAHRARLQRSLKTLKSGAKERVRVQFILASLDGLEALRLNDKALAGQSVERFKIVVNSGPSHFLADDALVMIARLRVLRGDRKRALIALKQVACHYRESDMLSRVHKSWAQWSPDPEMGPCSDGRRPAKARTKTTAPVKAPKSGMIGGLTETGGGGLEAAVEKIERIVVDPGHGGEDPGALGRGGEREADMAYLLSLDLVQVLRAKGFEVLMTRTKSQGLSLAERTRFANQQRADLFLSIHVSAAEHQRAHGVETYYLNTGSDRYATRLAARENKQTEEQLSTLAFILADLSTKGNTVDSRSLARLLQAEMKGLATDRKNELRAALFYVLLGARMPAVLFEAGFMTNDGDLRRLQDPVARMDLAKRLARGVERFAASVGP